MRTQVYQRYGKVTATDFQPSKSFVEAKIMKEKGRGGGKNSSGDYFIDQEKACQVRVSRDSTSVVKLKLSDSQFSGESFLGFVSERLSLSFSLC